MILEFICTSKIFRTEEKCQFLVILPFRYHHSLIISKTGMTKNQENCTEYFGD